ncbi:MAG: hypothetical protein AB7O45_03605, partial [Alphaproteobacteria bacterium]
MQLDAGRLRALALERVEGRGIGRHGDVNDQAAPIDLPHRPSGPGALEKLEDPLDRLDEKP